MGQYRPMELVGHYIIRVLAFTLRGTVRQADSWQIVAGGTALPSIALGIIYGLVGQDVPTIEQAEWASYFGYGLITWLAIRFLIAPFFIWREQYEDAAGLRLELSRPERMVMERLSKHRAKARAKLASRLEDFQTLAYAEEWTDFWKVKAAKQMGRIKRLQAEAGLSEAFESGRGRLLVAVQSEGDQPNASLPLDRESSRLLKLLQCYLVGDLTAEALALQLPSYTALETLP